MTVTPLPGVIQPRSETPGPALSEGERRWLVDLDATTLSGVERGRLSARLEQLTDRGDRRLLTDLLEAGRETQRVADQARRDEAALRAQGAGERLEAGRAAGRAERERRAAQTPFLAGLTPVGEDEGVREARDNLWRASRESLGLLPEERY